MYRNWNSYRNDSFPGIRFGNITKCLMSTQTFDLHRAREMTYSSIFSQDKCKSTDFRGIEIGALHQPANIPAYCHHTRKFVDKWPKADLMKKYPELKGSSFVDVDIIDDAVKLSTIATASQNYVIASHLLEHVEDVIGTIKSWLRVLKPYGSLILIVPNKCMSFDRQRVVTSIGHMVSEYRHPNLLKKNHDDHTREWVVSHMSRETFTLNPSIEELKKFDYYHQLMTKGKTFEAGGWHVHTWTVRSWLSFVSNLVLLLSAERYAYLNIEYISGGEGLLDLTAVLVKMKLPDH
jgi:predicted SAM-dependent methyltransferase